MEGEGKTVVDTDATDKSPTTVEISQVPMATIQCVYCQSTLSYPQNSLYIQCPKCTSTMNPQAPDTNYMNCIGCGTLLSHPPSSLTIQCPKCFVIMELPIRHVNVNVIQQTQNSGYGGGGSSSSGGGGGGGGVSSAMQQDMESRKPKKKRKDPHAPKRASNAYMIFCKERRAKLKEDRPDLPFGKLGARLGELWRLLSPEEKKPYETRASVDRERYKKEMASYQSSGGGTNSRDEPTDTKTQFKKQITGAMHDSETLRQSEASTSGVSSSLVSLQQVLVEPNTQQQLDLAQIQHHLLQQSGAISLQNLSSFAQSSGLFDQQQLSRTFGFSVLPRATSTSGATTPLLTPTPIHSAAPLASPSPSASNLQAKLQETELQAAQEQLAHHQRRFQDALRRTVGGETSGTRSLQQRQNRGEESHSPSSPPQATRTRTSPRGTESFS